MTFDTIVTVDWSGGNAKGPKPSADAIWVSVSRNGKQYAPLYFRSRQEVEPWLAQLMDEELTAGRRALFGFDFAFGYPSGFGQMLTGSDDPLAVWAWFEDRIEDAPKSNNRFDIAGQINSQLDGIGPFWGNGLKRDIPDLPRKGTARTNTDFAEKRVVETHATGAFSVWQLSGVGAVGSQVIMGLPVLERLRRRAPGKVAVWPFEPLDKPIAFVEVWPSLYADKITPRLGDHPIKDAVQMHVLTELIAQMPPNELNRHLNVPPTPEGWIFGVLP